MKQIIFSIVLFFFIGRDAIHAQCGSMPMFHQGTQFVFEQDITTTPLPVGSFQNQKKLPPTVAKRKNTYRIDSVRSKGGILSANFDLIKSENLTPNSNFKSNASSELFSGIQCNGNTISYLTDIKNSAMSGMNFTMDFPLNMKVGDKLKDQVSTIKIEKIGKNPAANITSIIRREVVANEMVTTPGGSWKCFKISQTVTVQVPAMNGRPAYTDNSSGISYIWFSPEMGLIKTQSNYGEGDGTVATLISVK